jgi:hypothetical protein
LTSNAFDKANDKQYHIRDGTISSVGMSEMLNDAFVARFSLCEKLLSRRKRIKQISIYREINKRLPLHKGAFLFSYDLLIFLTSTAFVDTNVKYGIPFSRYAVFLQNCP